MQVRPMYIAILQRARAPIISTSACSAIADHQSRGEVGQQLFVHVAL